MGKAKKQRRPQALRSRGLLIAHDVGWQTRPYRDVETGVEEMVIAAPSETS